MPDLDLTLVPSVVTSVAVVLGVVVGLRELNHLSRVREADVLRDISSRLSNPEFLKNFFLLMRMPYTNYDELQGKPEEIALVQYITFLEELGLMVKRGVVPLDVVDDYWHGSIRVIWTRTEPMVRSFREQRQHPEFGEWAEYLYLRIYGKDEGQAGRIKELEKKVYSKRIH